MPTKVIREPGHVDALAIILKGRKLPLTVSWAQGAARSGAQNRISHRWYQDISRQLGDRTTEDVRAECKRQYGVPILLRENVDFAASWERIMARLTYEEQVAAIRDFDLPVTRLLTVRQMTEYLDTMGREYRSQGLYLTDPEAMKYEEEFA